MAKLAREQKLRERRLEKEARRNARRDLADGTRLGGENSPPGSADVDRAATEAAPERVET